MSRTAILLLSIVVAALGMPSKFSRGTRSAPSRDRGSASNRSTEVTANDYIHGVHRTYNLEVQGVHSFTVSSSRLLVHNEGESGHHGITYNGRNMIVDDGIPFYQSAHGTAGKQ